MSGDPPAWPPRITLGRVHELHAAALTHAGGSPGVRDEGLALGAVEGALTAALYAGDDPVDPLLVAAYLLCYLARNHAFIDGNKRVAWLAFEDQLRLVGLRVEASVDEAETLVLAVVAKELQAEDVVDVDGPTPRGLLPDAQVAIGELLVGVDRVVVSDRPALSPRSMREARPAARRDPHSSDSRACRRPALQAPSRQ